MGICGRSHRAKQTVQSSCIGFSLKRLYSLAIIVSCINILGHMEKRRREKHSNKTCKCQCQSLENTMLSFLKIDFSISVKTHHNCIRGNIFNNVFGEENKKTLQKDPQLPMSISRKYNVVISENQLFHFRNCIRRNVFNNVFYIRLVVSQCKFGDTKKACK